jgi:hypothetical protein
MTEVVVHLRPARHNRRRTKPTIDPRLEPFLRALADLIARQVMRDIEEDKGNGRSGCEGCDLRP